MREPHPQNQVTHQPRGHVTNQKYFIFNFTRRKALKLSRVVTIRMGRPLANVMSSITPSYDNYPVGSVELFHFQLKLSAKSR